MGDDTKMQKMIKTMQWFYAIAGLLLLAIVVPKLFNNIAELIRWKRAGTDHWGLGGFIYLDLFYFGILSLNAASFITIAIAFYKRKRWGRYLAIAHNTILLIGFSWLIIYLFPNRNALTPPSQIFYPIAIFLLFAAITALLFHKESKRILSRIADRTV